MTLGVTHLIYEAEFYKSTYNLKWYYNTTENSQFLSYDLPMVSAYDESNTYTFSIDYSATSNTLRFYLVLQSDQRSTIDLCKINYVFYDESLKKLSINVYLYGNGTTVDMRIA